MSAFAANFFVLAIVVVLVLLALQAEPITATLGFVFATLLMVALLAHVIRSK
jgi:hypothetical protein